MIYDEGQGVRQDFTEAAAWYKKAASRGNVQSAKWFRMAAENNHVLSHYAWGCAA
jgi:TPR repeat protein